MENGEEKLTKLRIELADLKCISSDGCPGCRRMNDFGTFKLQRQRY